MASLPIYNKSGDQVGKYEIDPAKIAPKISQQLARRS
jgi:large subunit ribosomal protein L4